ncbi:MULTISPECIES: hypothetical protein [unclassified Spirosoma]|uniref:hypothetical protein n=1 Tax=unclassified Spirosoma TaxID=2621999 RepID=UPI00095B6747|nr:MULTISPECIES: hypothetical protein [unclassified Spirosoma]MBN8820524.1 hypothetical protein [Spirosoma sp.]OJW71721.1 MAG: hypothetical protein BGO59_27545 [Spirosoma sp. 48-14]
MKDQIQTLLTEQNIKQIQIYRFHDSKLHAQSAQWILGHEYIQVGDSPYNLNRLMNFRVADEVLRLYFANGQ